MLTILVKVRETNPSYHALTIFLVEALLENQICYISIHGKQRVELQTDKSISDVWRIQS